jgi:ABC-type antimicrobial peptide transport system permease subunit
VPFQQYFNVGLSTRVLVRTSGDPSRFIPALRREVAALDPELGGFHSVPLSEYIVIGLMAERIASGFMTAIAVIALLLAAVGLYSVMAYSVMERSREMAIRMALGASPGGVTRLVLAGGLGLCAAGLAAGLTGSVWAATMLEHKLVGVSPRDPLIIGAVAVFLLLTGALASYLPARRATQIDPMSAMRA